MIGKLMRYVFPAIVALVVASCSSTRKLERQPMIGGLTGQAYIEKIIELSPEWKSLNGKVALNLDLGGQKSMKVTATFRLKRGESIQLLVAPLLGIEVARLEISPDGLLVLDRMNKRYVQLSFDEVSRWAHTELNYTILQSLFLNEVFLPDRTRLTPEDADAFHVTLDGDDATLRVKAARTLSYLFRTSAAQGLLEESSIAVSGTPYVLNWKYSDFAELDNKLYPRQMKLDVGGVDKPVKLDMQFSRLSVNGEWESRTEVSSRYTRIGMEDIIKMLGKQ